MDTQTLISNTLKRIKPVLGNKKELRRVVKGLSAEEAKALREEYIPLVSSKPHWKEDQNIVSKIAPLL